MVERKRTYRQYNGQKKKDKQMIYKNTTQKIKYWATRKHHKRNGCVHRYSGRVSSSCSTTGI